MEEVSCYTKINREVPPVTNPAKGQASESTRKRFLQCPQPHEEAQDAQSQFLLSRPCSPVIWVVGITWATY